MRKVLTKLLLITFLIQSMRSQKVTLLQDKNDLSQELDDGRDLSDSESRSQDKRKTLVSAGHVNQNGDNKTQHEEQQTSEQYDQTVKRTGKASKLNDEGKNKSEHKTQNKNQDKDSQSNQVDERNISEQPDNLNEDGKQRSRKLKHESPNQKRPHKNSSHVMVDLKTTNNTSKNKTLDENANPSPKAEQKTPGPLNKERSIHTFKHTIVTGNDFAYMVAVMKGASYLSAGALIDESWVLTAAATRGIHLMRENIRLLRIRLGSINYKKGGTLLPVKYLEIHPYANSSKPDYDLALIMLSKPVRYTANLRSIRLQLKPMDVTATHFISTSWPGIVKPETSQPTEVIKHHRILSVSHLHPVDSEECVEELTEIGASHDGVMCFTGVEDACLRDAGAPVVINGVLWGILSSWRPEDCHDEDSIFATLVSAKNVRTWIHATVHGHRWHPETKQTL